MPRSSSAGDQSHFLSVTLYRYTYSMYPPSERRDFSYSSFWTLPVVLISLPWLLVNQTYFLRTEAMPKFLYILFFY